MRERLAALNPTASARVANRLLEAHERSYWQPDEQTLAARQRVEAHAPGPGRLPEVRRPACPGLARQGPEAIDVPPRGDVDVQAQSLGDDVEHALYLLLQAAEHPRILKDPPAVSRLLEFADYGMEIELRFWIGDPAEGVNNVRSDVNRRIWALFREHGITIPPAQREIRILEGGKSASMLAPRSGAAITPTTDGQD